MASQELPYDMISEILCRTTLKTLDACKCVAKAWKQRIEESDFLPRHCQTANNVYGFFIQGGKCRSTFLSYNQLGGSSVELLPRDMKILSSCNQGLLCCVKWTKNHNHRYYVCKPTTGQWQALPNPKLRHWTMAVSMVVLGSTPLHYKIVRLSEKGFTRSREHYQYRCEIFDSTLWRWKESQTLNLPNFEFPTTMSIFVQSSFNWLTTNDSIVAFHEPTESFSKFKLPGPMIDNKYDYNYQNLMNYQGRLGLSCLTHEGKVEQWLNEGDPFKQKQADWKKHIVVDVNYDIETISKRLAPIGFYNSGIVFFKDFSRGVFYKIEERALSIVKLSLRYWHTDEIFQFRSDFEEVCLKP